MTMNKKYISVVASVAIASGALMSTGAIVSAAEKEELSGANRYQTAVEISKKGWANGAENVVIVNDSAIADALAATPFAESKNAPILLTGAKSLNLDTAAEIKRLNAKNVYLIGGESVLSESLKDSFSGMTVERISGDTREETALAIAEKLENVKEVAVVNGTTGLADAVSIASTAAEKDMAILLSNPKKGVEASEKYIKDNNIEKAYVIGGTSAVSDEIMDTLPNAERIAGSNRNATNAAVVDKFYTSSELKNIYVAKNGMEDQGQLIDALSVGVLAAKNNSPVAIVSSKGLSDEQKESFSKKTFATVTKVGGNGNEKAFEEIYNLHPEQNVTTVTDPKKLGEAIESAPEKSTVTLKPSSEVSDAISINTDKEVTVVLEGKYTGKITLESSKISLVNKGDISSMEIKVNPASFKNEVGATITNLEALSENALVINNSGTINTLKDANQKVTVEGNKPVETK